MNSVHHKRVRRAGIALAILLQCHVASAGSDRARRPSGAVDLSVEGDYVHASGIRFPVVVDNARRIRVRSFPQFENSNSVVYELGQPRIATVSVFVYPANNSLATEMSKAIAAVEQVEKATLESRTEFRFQESVGEAAELTYQKANDPSPRVTRIHLLRSGSWFLKYRTTISPDVSPQHANIDQLMKALGLPRAIGD